MNLSPKHIEPMKANKELLYKHVQFLTTLRPFRDYKNRASLEKVCHYLKKEFTNYGLEVVEQPFIARGAEYKDIIVAYNRTEPRRLIGCAHYDVCGGQPGADDNARRSCGIAGGGQVGGRSEPRS